MIVNFLSYIKNIIIYFAIIQSFLLAIHFYTNKQLNSIPNKILALLILLFGMSVLSAQLYIDKNIEFLYHSKWLVHIRIQINLILIVLFFFHIKSIVSKEFQLIKIANLLFFIPILGSVIYFRHQLLVTTPWPAPFNSNLFIQISIVNVIYNLIYFSFLFSLLKKQFKSFSIYRAITKNPNTKWLSFIIGTFIFLWLSELVLLLMMISERFDKIFPYLIFFYTIVPFIFINTILVFTLKNPKIFIYKKNNNGINPKKNQSNLIDQVYHLLITDKIYTDPELSLPKVAERLNVNPKYLSIEINENLNQTFTDLINNFRITESKKLLSELPDKTIQEIMFEVGFNSKSVFNSHFKKDTGLTPKEFRLKNKVN